ncbi:MAG: PA14 domain-containing protein, partial [Myxococcota bacterium]
FITDPRGVKPGTTMPDVFGTSDDATRQGAADALTHYLISLRPQRFSIQAPDRVAAVKGRELFHSIGCVACHSPRDEDGNELLKEGSAPLGRLDRKYSVETLTAFLEIPHRTRPSGRMPDFHLAPLETHQIANYLTRDTRVPGPLRYTLFLDGMEEGLDRLDGKERQAGLASGFDLGGFEKYREEFALHFEGYLEITRAGEYTFSLQCNHVGRLTIDGQALISLAKSGGQVAIVLLDPGLHSIDLVYLHTAGEPSLDLQLSGPGIEKGPLPASMLRSERSGPKALAPHVVDAARAEKGKSLFTELGCSSCHQNGHTKPARALPDLSNVNPAKGCLSGGAGNFPSYALSVRQVEEIRAALAATDFVPTPEQKVRSTLAAFNCIACHQRGEWGGIPASRNDYYRSADGNLGETGRIPPPLTGVGAKLQLDWLRKTIASGQSLRPYMTMRMPGFGNDNVGHLGDLFEKIDEMPAVVFDPPPRGRDRVRAVRDMGRLLVGDKGMSCITCHTFGGRKAGTMAAVDLVETTTQRLRKDWFYYYMLQPVRFRSITIMPQFFPEGMSILRDVADGDPRTQLDAMWHYLAEGRNARQPSGMRRPRMEIVVGDEAVMLRRSAQDTGKRAISVGYPLGVNLTFDSESVSLNQIWWGKFVDPGGVWTGQGSGSARIMSRDRVRLGKGPAFAELADETTPWPTQTSRALGLRFRGYELDEQRRPTFQYMYRDVAITDKPVDLRDENGRAPFLRRTLTLRGPQDRVLFFRAAVHREIEVDEAGAIKIGRSVRMSVRGSSGESSSIQALTARIRPSAKDMEVIVPVRIRQGKATLILEYRWLEASR